MSYLKTLLDPKWVSKRKKILKRDKYKCTVCGSKKDLQVHHQYYISNNPPWKYPDSALITLCEHCHHKYHTEHELTYKKKKGRSPQSKKPKFKKKVYKPIESKEPRYRKKVNGSWVVLSPKT